MHSLAYPIIPCKLLKKSFNFCFFELLGPFVYFSVDYTLIFCLVLVIAGAEFYFFFEGRDVFSKKTRKFCRPFFKSTDITRPNCALDRSKILCLYAPGFLRHVKILSERSKRRKGQKKNKGASL